MSYTDLLQSYQDRLSSMVQNEDSVGDYLLNKSQDKINSYLEQAGIPGQIGGVIDQISILANNSAVKTFLQKTGLNGVADEQIESLNRTVGDLKGQIQAFAEKSTAAIDRQVAAAQEAARPLVQQSQAVIDTARTTETQARAAVQTAQELPAQAQTAATELGERVPTLDEALSSLRSQAPRDFIAENIPEGAGEIVENIGGLPPRGARPTSGVSEEPNVRPSQIDRDAPEFETGAQQLPQAPIPQAPAAPAPPVRPQPPSEIEPATEPQAQRPTGYEPPEEMVERPPPGGEMSEIIPTVEKTEETTEEAISTTQKVATGLEETSAAEGEFGEVGEVLGALLQIGSLIASAFSPHENVQTISTPISGFGFGANNQFGVGGSSIV